jgi:hypothetical protein
MKREQAISDLTAAQWENLADDHATLSTFLMEVLRGGHRGFAEMTNEELEAAYDEWFGDEIAIDGFDEPEGADHFGPEEY